MGYKCHMLPPVYLTNLGIKIKKGVGRWLEILVEVDEII